MHVYSKSKIHLKIKTRREYSMISEGGAITIGDAMQ
jgi:hypothetical protein